MKRIIILIVAGVLILMAFGCQSDSEVQTDAAEITQKVAETAGDVATMRDDFISKAEEKLSGVSGQMNEWKDKAAGLSSATKPMAEQAITAVESAIQVASTSLSNLKLADVSKFTEMLPNVKDAMGKLDGAIDKVKSFF